MNILGIGPMEMGVIAVIALLIFGPGKLPEVMGQAGKMVRDFRRMTADLTGEFEKTMAEAKDITSGITNELGGMTKQVNSVTSSVKKDLAGNKKTTTTPAKSTSTSKSTTTATKSSTSTAAKSAKSSTSPTSNTSKTTTVAKPAKPPTPVASREDPTNAFSLFEPDIVEKPRRTRTASPKAIPDLMPRDILAEQGDDETSEANSTAADDPLARARQRRRTAGYGGINA